MRPKRLEAYEQAKLNHLPIFSSDGTLITGLNMDEQLLFDYYMKYIHSPILMEHRPNDVRWLAKANLR